MRVLRQVVEAPRGPGVDGEVSPLLRMAEGEEVLPLRAQMDREGRPLAPVAGVPPVRIAVLEQGEDRAQG